MENRPRREGQGQKEEHKLGGSCNNPREIMAAWTNVVVLQVLRNGQIVEYLEDTVDGVLFCFFTDCMWGVGERSQG